jgi:hypothetical protein
MGFDAIGVDVSAKRCRAARALCFALDHDDALARGVALFNSHAFFEAHEAWEERWRVEKDETERRFLQGLIQIAAAFHKLLVLRSTDAAARLLARGLAKLEACPPREGFVVGAFRNAARAIDEGHFDRSDVPQLGPLRAS